MVNAEFGYWYTSYLVGPGDGDDDYEGYGDDGEI